MNSSSNLGKRYMLVIFKWWWLLVLLPLIAGGITYLNVKDQPHIYQAEAQLLIGPGIDSPDPDYNTLRASGQVLQTYKEMVSTDTFLQDVIHDVGMGEMLPSTLLEMIDVRADPNSLILTVTAQAGTPKQAVDIANSVAKNLVRLSPANPGNPAAISREQNKAQADQLDGTIQETQARINTLDQQLQQLSQQDPAVNSAINERLTSAEHRVDFLEAQYQSATDVAAQEQQGIAMLQELIQKTYLRIQQLEASLVGTNPNMQNLVLEQISAEKDHLSNLQKAISENQQTIEGASLDIYIQNTQTNIANLEAKFNSLLPYDINNKRLINDQIDSERTRLVNAGKMAIARQEEVFNQLADERKRLFALRMLPVAQRDYLSGVISQERNRLTSLEQTHAGLVEALFQPWTNQVKITQPASTSTRVPSNMRLYILVAIIAGFALALAIVITLGYFDHSFQTASELEQAISVTSLGMIQESHSLFKRKVAPEEQLPAQYMPDSVTARDYRLLAARLSSKLHGLEIENRPAKNHRPACITLMICGLYSDEGTSQIAANLGIVLAQTEQRVLLVEAGMKDSWIAGAFGIPNDAGLAAALSNGALTVQPMPSPTQKNLLLMSGGPIPPDPFGLIASPLLPALLEDWKKQVSLILIAASPLMSSAEAFILASQVDGIVLNTATEKTKPAQAEEFVKNRATYLWKILGSVTVVQQRGIRTAIPPFSSYRGRLSENADETKDGTDKSHILEETMRI